MSNFDDRRYTHFSSSIYDKIDHRLIQKTKTLDSVRDLSAIVYSSSDTIKGFKEHLEDFGATIKYELPFMCACAIEISSNQIEEMARSEHVKYISDDVKTTTLLNIATQGVGASIVNRTGYKGEGVGIAILDTGVYPHPDLIMPRSRIVAFKDFVNKKQSAYDDNGHGTFVAGAAAGNGYSSVGRYTGVAPMADIISVKVMNSKGEGNSSDILAGMQWVVDNKERFNIKIMSLSLGSKAVGRAYSDSLAVAAGSVWNRGITVIAAAGNSGPESGTITTPGVNNKVITVGAVDDKRTVDIKDDTIAKFSSRGPVGRLGIKPDVVAPGVDIISLNTDKSYISGMRPLTLREQYRKMSGTSVATPIVSGAVALLLGKSPNLSPEQIKKRMLDSGRSLSADIYAQGRGIIDVKKLLEIS